MAGEHQQTSVLMSDSWSLGNLWSTITFGWFGSTQQSPEESSCERVKEGNVMSTSVAGADPEGGHGGQMSPPLQPENDGKRLQKN